MRSDRETKKFSVEVELSHFLMIIDETNWASAMFHNFSYLKIKYIREINDRTEVIQADDGVN